MTYLYLMYKYYFRFITESGKMKRNLFLVLFITICTKATAQQEKFTKFYNEYWKHTTEQNAKYKVDLLKVDTLYQATAYFLPSKKLESRSTWADTALSKPRGLSISYNENGIVKDSTNYFDNGKVAYSYKYKDDGKLFVYYRGDREGNEIEVKGYDESGKIIKGFIYEKEAAFPGGHEAWNKFIANTAKRNVPIKNGAPNGKYTAVVRFIVNTKGMVTDIEAETNNGYGMEEELIRVLKKAPKWNNAVQYNQPVNAYRRQPLTFVVQ